MAVEPGIEPSDVLLAVTTLSFDIALLELMMPLVSGAQVVIASREVAADGAQLLALMIKTNATMLQATPATWRMLLDVGWQGEGHIKALCGGEAFPSDIAERLLDRCASVWNMYGPTETTVWSTIHQVTSATPPILIGRPIANTEIYILDERLQPVSIGVPGVLYIGGSGLARGYLNRPELTNEKFIPHPFSSEAGARIYNTGDMARYLADGSIECLGRIDHQVKIRGFRIELGEIESQLGDHPQIHQNVVVAREDTPGDKALVAYLVLGNHQGRHPQSDDKLPIRDIRDFLRKELPNYMIPSAFVFLDELPLTPNGKVDRLALPVPNVSRDSLEQRFIAPRDPLEVAVAAIWEEQLNMHPIGVNDDFFELGGTSLAAVRLFAHLERELEATLPIAALFEAPTVAQLAQVIRGDSKVAQWTSLVKIQQGTNVELPPLFLFHGAGGAVLLYRMLAQHIGPEQTIYGIQAAGLDPQQQPHTTIEEMADLYLHEIMQVQPQGPYLLGGYCMGGSIALEMAQRLQGQGQEVAFLGLLETYNWHRGSTLGASAKLIHTIEKIDFHLRNLILSDAKGKRLFFKEKFDELVRRVRMTRDDLLKRRSGGNQEEEAFATASQVWEMNDEASLLYQPTTYPGRISHFITRRQYACYSGPAMAWDTMAKGGVDTVTLNVYPAGMLLEPFVQELAEEMNKRIRFGLTDYQAKTAEESQPLQEQMPNAHRLTI